MSKFDYVCLHDNGKSFVLDEFAILAEIISQTDTHITYKKYTKFGELKWQPVTVPLDDFYFFYIPLTDEMRKKVEENKFRRRV